MLELRGIFPDCRVNLDYGGCLNNQPTYLAASGVMNLAYYDGSVNFEAHAFGMMADTITITDDGKGDLNEVIAKACRLAPLAHRILVLHKGAQAYSVCVKQSGSLFQDSSLKPCM